MKKIFKNILFGILFFFSIFISYFFIGSPPQAGKISWGINFSQKHSQRLGLDWKENYLAALNDLKVKNIKLITHWDLIESERDKYFFDDLDWQIREAEKREVEIILVIGMKTGHWPECHLPNWAKNLSKKNQQKEILELLKEIVLRYQDFENIWAWQVENEPLFPFGECPWREKKFLKKEIDLVKSLDSRPILISDSGEFSFWIKTARWGEILGITLHKRVYFKEVGKYIDYPFPPVFYWRRKKLIEKFFGKEVICVELQAEPWCKNLIYHCPLEEQKITMDLEKFKENIEFAKKTGLDTFYFWGAEWWYWLKEKQNQPQIWQQASELFQKQIQPI